jgi:plastocyanin
VIARRTGTLLAVAGLAALAAGPAHAGPPAAKRKPQKKTVKVYDNYFGPTKLTVNAGSIVTWKWTELAADVHDVKLTKGPKGAKRFWSDPGAVGYAYKQRLTKPGTYRILCTFHEEDDMRMTILVRK